MHAHYIIFLLLFCFLSYLFLFPCFPTFFLFYFSFRVLPFFLRPLFWAQWKSSYNACRDQILLFFPLTTFVWSGCKSRPIEHFTSSRNFRKKDSGVPNGSDMIRQKGRVHHGPCLAVAKSRPHSFSNSVPFGENRGILSCAFGKTMVAQAPIGSIHLSLVCKRKIEWQDDTHNRKPLTIRVGRSPFSRNYVL